MFVSLFSSRVPSTHTTGVWLDGVHREIYWIKGRSLWLKWFLVSLSHWMTRLMCEGSTLLFHWQHQWNKSFITAVCRKASNRHTGKNIEEIKRRIIAPNTPFEPNSPCVPKNLNSWFSVRKCVVCKRGFCNTFYIFRDIFMSEFICVCCFA